MTLVLLFTNKKLLLERNVTCVKGITEAAPRPAAAVAAHTKQTKVKKEKCVDLMA